MFDIPQTALRDGLGGSRRIVGEVCFGGRGREGERWSEDGGGVEDEGDNLC